MSSCEPDQKSGKQQTQSEQGRPDQVQTGGVERFEDPIDAGDGDVAGRGFDLEGAGVGRFDVVVVIGRVVVIV